MYQFSPLVQSTSSGNPKMTGQKQGSAFRPFSISSVSDAPPSRCCYGRYPPQSKRTTAAVPCVAGALRHYVVQHTDGLGVKPSKPKGPCRYPVCPNLSDGGYCGAYCIPFARENAASRGYGSQWRIARARFLRSHPLCVKCMKQGLAHARYGSRPCYYAPGRQETVLG